MSAPGTSKDLAADQSEVVGSALNVSRTRLTVAVNVLNLGMCKIKKNYAVFFFSVL